MASSQNVRGVVVGLSPALVESVSGSGDDCMERNEAELPLSGVTVVSLEQAIAAPLPAGILRIGARASSRSSGRTMAISAATTIM